jgi:hypothetical protein
VSTHVIRVYCPGKWINANHNHHKFARSTLVARWRENTVAACITADLPKNVTAHVTITPVVIYTGRAPALDSPNLEPTAKAVVDGLGPSRTITRVVKDKNTGQPVIGLDGKPITKTSTTHGYGFLLNDSDRHITRMPLRMRKAEPGELHTAIGCIELTLTYDDPPPAEETTTMQPDLFEVT